jgi:hypothetical protein
MSPVANVISQVWSSKLLLALEKNLIFAQPNVISRDHEPEIRAEGDRVHIHSFSDPTIATYTKNSTVISYEQMTDSRQTLLIDQSKYFALKQEDIEAVQSKPELLDAVVDRASYALAEVADRFVAGLYSGMTNFTATSQATSSNVYQKVVETRVKLDEKNAPPDNRFIIVPPWVAGLLLQNATFLAASLPSTLNGAIGMVSGMNVLVSNNVPTSGSAPVVSHCVAGHARGWGYAEQILNLEALRLEGSFSDGMRGLHVYGGKVLDQDSLHVLRVNA